MRAIRRVLAYFFLVLVVVVLAAGSIYLNAQRKLAAHYDNPVQADLKVAGTPEQIERGKYLVGTMPGCAGCHAANPAANPPLLDGNRMAELTALGEFYAPNLTPGGPLKGWTDQQFLRTTREGVDPSNHQLAETMPWRQFGRATDDDLRALYEYIKALP